MGVSEHTPRVDLLFGRGLELKSPAEAALLPPQLAESVDLADYREELMLSLATARELVVQGIKAAQSHYRSSTICQRKLWTCELVLHAISAGRNRQAKETLTTMERTLPCDDPDVTVVKVYYPEEGPLHIQKMYTERESILVPVPFL